MGYEKITHADSPQYLAIINPVAKSGAAARAIDGIRQGLSSLDVTYLETEYPRHAIELAAEAEGYSVVIAIGGDGTVHEIVNGLMRLDADKRPALGIIPCGSGNDTCRMIGSPLDVGAAIHTIARNNQRSFDVGLCNDTYFVNSFSLGIDALTVERTRRLKEETGRSGMLLYGQALLGIILNEMRPTVLDVTIDGNTHRHRVLLNAITNGQTYGSGFRINPMAKPHDGTLTLSHIDWMPRLRVLSYIPRLLRATHTTIPEYQSREITACTISDVSDKLITAQIDGELLKERTFEVEVRPQAINFVV